jgi:hypothetical protein
MILTKRPGTDDDVSDADAEDTILLKNSQSDMERQKVTKNLTAPNYQSVHKIFETPMSVCITTTYNKLQHNNKYQINRFLIWTTLRMKICPMAI